MQPDELSPKVLANYTGWFLASISQEDICGAGKRLGDAAPAGFPELSTSADFVDLQDADRGQRKKICDDDFLIAQDLGSEANPGQRPRPFP